MISERKHEMEEMEMKNDYSRNYFWVKTNKKNGEKIYYFKIDGKLKEVSKEVFNVCFSSYRKVLRDNQRDEYIEMISIDNNKNDERLTDNKDYEMELINDIDKREKIEMVLKAFDTLDEDEKNLLINLLIVEKSEREIANQLNVSQPAIHKRKNAIIKKLKKKVNK